MTSALILSVYRNDTLDVLETMFRSLFEQSTQAFDILVQEDGPVAPEVDAYLEMLHREGKIAHLGRRSQNRGLAYSLNELIGVALERGYGLIFRMDSDDICVPERIALQTAYMAQHPEVDLLGGWIEEFNTDSGERQVVTYAQTHDAIVRFLQKRSPMAHVTVVFRRGFFDKAGFYHPESLCEDLDLWIRALQAGCRFHNLQQVLVRVRTNDAFYARRKNLRRAYEVMVLKLKASRLFGFGWRGYFYAAAHFLVFMAPGRVKALLYRKMRTPEP